MPGWATGLASGFGNVAKQKIATNEEMKKAKYTADREQALTILKQLAEGNIKPAGEGETPVFNAPDEQVAPQGIGQRIMQGFGLQQPQTRQGQGYVAQPNLDRQLKQATIDYLTGGNNNAGNMTMTTPAKTPDEALTRIPKGENPKDYKVSPKSIMVGRVPTVSYEATLDPKLQESRLKGEERGRFIKESAQDTLDTIGEVEKGINKFGLWGQLPSIPGTERALWEANVNKLLSGKIINLMTEMKEASKTGATGFGQLSEKELEVLKGASTALKRNLPPEAAQKILNDMKAKLQRIVATENPEQVAPTNNGEIPNQPMGDEKQKALEELKRRGRI